MRKSFVIELLQTYEGNKSAKFTQNKPVGNNNIFDSMIFQLIEFLSCYLTIMST